MLQLVKQKAKENSNYPPDLCLWALDKEGKKAPFWCGSGEYNPTDWQSHYQITLISVVGDFESKHKRIEDLSL